MNIWTVKGNENRGRTILLILNAKYKLSVCMYVCMNVCMYVWMDGWMDELIDV